jgi:hypothetical protein
VVFVIVMITSDEISSQVLQYPKLRYIWGNVQFPVEQVKGMTTVLGLKTPALTADCSPKSMIFSCAPI